MRRRVIVAQDILAVIIWGMSDACRAATRASSSDLAGIHIRVAVTAPGRVGHGQNAMARKSKTRKA